MADFKQKFYDITALIQHEFDRNMELYGDKIQCRKGCSKCCSQIFRITKLDGWMISEHVKSLPELRRTKLQQKAREYIKRLPHAKSKNWLGSGDPEELKNDIDPATIEHANIKKIGNITEPGQIDIAMDTVEDSRLPCPALGTEGECTIYEARPIICRRFGMPIFDYKNPTKIHACDLNFSDDEEITDNKLVMNQSYIGLKWDELKDDFGVGSTTIAEAIVNA